MVRDIYPAKPLDVNDTGKTDLWKYDGKLMDRLIDSDYDTVELRSRYNELLEEQEKNPVNIVIDNFLYDGTEPEQFFQRAYVKGKKFEQDIYYHPKLREPRPTTINFLEKACKYANQLAKRV